MSSSIIKTCMLCRQEKRVVDFSICKQIKSGYRSICKLCMSAQRKKYYYKNKEKISIYKKEYRLKNKDRIIAQKKQYRLENKLKIALYGKEYYYNNKEKISLGKKNRYQKNKERHSIRARKYYLENKKAISVCVRRYECKRLTNDPIFRITKALRQQVRKALKKYTSTGKKSMATEKLLGCTFEYFIEYLQRLFKVGMTWKNYGKWHIDHIKPCASFDLSKLEAQKKCFHYTNLQPLWAEENLKKGAKIIDG